MTSTALSLSCLHSPLPSFPAPWSTFSMSKTSYRAWKLQIPSHTPLLTVALTGCGTVLSLLRVWVIALSKMRLLAILPLSSADTAARRTRHLVCDLVLCCFLKAHAINIDYRCQFSVWQRGTVYLLTRSVLYVYNSIVHYRSPSSPTPSTPSSACACQSVPHRRNYLSHELPYSKHKNTSRRKFSLNLDRTGPRSDQSERNIT